MLLDFWDLPTIVGKSCSFNPNSDSDLTSNATQRPCTHATPSVALAVTFPVKSWAISSYLARKSELAADFCNACTFASITYGNSLAHITP